MEYVVNADIFFEAENDEQAAEKIERLQEALATCEVERIVMAAPEWAE